ncbi:P-loop containing nucleoside triphosphate hydrolase protein [Schizophyllum commune]
MSSVDLIELSDEAVCARVSAAFGVDLCRWQVQAIRSLCKREPAEQQRDHCLISATGSGKTVTFLGPLLFVPQGTIIIITPLNLLSDQVASQLNRIGIPAIALSAENAHQRTFQSIQAWKYRVVITNIEIALKPRGHFEKLWRDKKWTSRLICVVWDEAHCVSKWADFRVEYKNAGRIRQLLHEPVPYYLTSATLPKPVLHDVYRNLGISPSNVNLIHRSNDRPNIHLSVRGFKHRKDTYRDLDFVVPSTGRPPPFIIFFNSIRESVEAVKHLQSLLPFKDRLRIKWFNSHMTSQYRQDELKNFEEGSTWGLACTDSFGLGVDSVRRIELAIQFGVDDIDACTLAQRLGRAMRSGDGDAIALLLAEARFFDAERDAKEARKQEKAQKENKKRKSDAVVDGSRKGPRADESRLDTHAARQSMLEERRVVYNTAAVEVPKKRKSSSMQAPEKVSAIPDPALDDMVNAASRGFNCYRLPAQIYFENDKMGTRIHSSA